MAPERRKPVEPRSGGPAPTPQVPLARAAMSDPDIPRPPLSGPHGAAAPAVRSSRLLALRARGSELWRSPRGRRVLVGAAVAVELAALVAVVSVGLDSSVDAVARPASMTGTVHDVGVGGVNLRSAPQVATSTARNVALDGTTLMIQCGVTGAVVSGPAGDSPLWFRTVDDKYVSMLYVRLPGRAFVPSCGASADAPLVAVANPDLPAPSALALGAPLSASAAPGTVDPGIEAGSSSTGGSAAGSRRSRGGTPIDPRGAPKAQGARAPSLATAAPAPGNQNQNGDGQYNGDDNGDQNNGGQNNGDQNGDQPQG